MVNVQFWICFALGGAGAAILELVRLEELRGKLPARKWKNLFKSYDYWIITLGLIASSGFFAWVISSSSAVEQKVSPLFVVAAGISTRSIVRSLAAAKAATGKSVLGVIDNATSPRSAKDPELPTPKELLL